MRDEMDILREVGTIAAAQAGTAVSEILGRKISIDLPSLETIAYEELHGKTGIQRTGVAVFSRMLSGLHGEIALLLDEKDAYKLMGLSYQAGGPDQQSGVFTEVGLSVMKEIGNIAICSYTTALGIMLKRQIITSIPTLMSGSTDTLLAAIFRMRAAGDSAFLIEASFKEPQTAIQGRFCLGLTNEAAADVMTTCKRALEEMERNPRNTDTPS